MFNTGLKITVEVPGMDVPVELHALNFLQRQPVAADFRKDNHFFSNWEPNFKVIKVEVTNQKGEVVGDGAEVLRRIVNNLTLTAQNDKNTKRQRKS